MPDGSGAPLVFSAACAQLPREVRDAVADVCVLRRAVDARKKHDVHFVMTLGVSLKDEDEVYRFFQDVCTVNELMSLSQRFAVARMLTQKKTYLEIAQEYEAAGAECISVRTSSSAKAALARSPMGS